ncbi:MAG: TlpA disulfide reductase family protein [Candidatus Solibacter sp.]
MAARRQRQILDIGTPAPGFRLAALEGGEATLAGLTAEARVLLVFFKISCPVCQLSMPFLERLHASGGLRIYGISQNDAESTREFAEYFKVSFPILLDSEDEDFPASNEYGISSVPTMFLVEPDGVISRVLEGWNRIDMEGLGAEAGIGLFREGDNVPAWKAG